MNKKSNPYKNKVDEEKSAIDYSVDVAGAAYTPPNSDLINYCGIREDNSVIYMDISTEGGRTLRTGETTQPHLIGRLYFEIRCDLLPLTTTNFLSLLVNAKGIGADGVKYAYKGTKIHRVVKNLLFQGGDLMGMNGHCSKSIYNKGGLFVDENFIFRHTGKLFYYILI